MNPASVGNVSQPSDRATPPSPPSQGGEQGGVASCQTIGAGPGGGDALQCLDALREALRGLDSTPALDRASPCQGSDRGVDRRLFRRVLPSLEQIMVEHRGMADELISVYEQLGIIFEVTRKLPTVDSESEVIGLFVESLQRSFAGREVFIARPAAGGDWMRIMSHVPGGARRSGGTEDVKKPNDGTDRQKRKLDNRLSPLLRRLCASAQARTVVESLSPVESGEPHSDPATADRADVLIGPVFSGEHLVCAIVIVRSVPTVGGPAAPEFRASDMQLVESLAKFCGDLIRSHRLVRELREMSISMVRSLVSAVDQKDEYTCGHSLRVGYYATTLGRLLNLKEVELQMLQWAALLHDVGKIGIRDDVLNKEGKLTPEEFRHIQEHPTRSHRVVQQVPQLADALDGILHHHERYDGSGYPAKLAGERIPLQARIIQIADVFDALTSSRSYRPAYDWRKALDILREEAGKTVDPHLQQVFDRHMRAVLESDPKAWERKVERANQFASAFSSTEDSWAAEPSADPAVGAMAIRSRA